MVMGDLVLLESEVNPVIAALEAAGLQVTALHNHFLWEQPRLMFMHIQGLGDLAKLAQGLRDALKQTAAPMTTPAAAPVAIKPPPEAPALDTKKIERIVGEPGQAGGGVFKITIGRRGVKMGGKELTSAQGLNSWAGFVGTDEKAHVAGDIAMTAKEVNRVIKALKAGGIEVVAVHNHMLDEEPRIFFLHYWGSGPADKLAQAVKAAFNQVRGPAK